MKSKREIIPLNKKLFEEVSIEELEERAELKCASYTSCEEFCCFTTPEY